MQISPGSPGGTGRPSSSSRVMSVLGMGRPMLPVQAVASTGLQVAAGEVSDRP